MIPAFILQIWLFSLFALGVLVSSAYLATEWLRRSWVWDASQMQSVFRPDWGFNEHTAILGVSLLLLLFTLLGGSLVRLILAVSRSQTGGQAAKNQKN